MSRAFEGSGAGPLAPDARLECGVCWWVYDPVRGDETWDVAAGTPFTALPDHWRCPSCDADRAKFMLLAPDAPTLVAHAHDVRLAVAPEAGDAPVTPVEPRAPSQSAGAQSRDAADRDPTALDGRVARLVAAYRAAESEMAGLPIHNPALSVEAVGFRSHGAVYAGVIVTPWCMNLVVMPADPDAPAPGPLGSTRSLSFPSGAYSFVVGRMDGVGAVETCSLFSPMDEFDAHDVARSAARSAADGLFAVPEPEPVSRGPAVTRRFALTRNGSAA